MSNPTTDFDSPWKDIITTYFEDFMLFFCPQAHAQIDWSKGFEFLDKELQQVTRNARYGRRFVDKLVKVHLQTGKKAWVLIHIEIQSQRKRGLARRVFIYNYRIFDLYKRYSIPYYLFPIS